MKLFFALLAIAVLTIGLAVILNIAWWFYYMKVDYTETTFFNASESPIQSIDIFSDNVHTSLTPDQNGKFRKVFLIGDVAFPYPARITCHFSDGKTLNATVDMIPREAYTMVIRNSSIDQAIGRSSTF